MAKKLTGKVALVTGGSRGIGAVKEADWREPTEEEIRKRAYELYRERERECKCGGPLDDWLEAEAELLMRRQPRNQ